MIEKAIDKFLQKNGKVETTMTIKGTSIQFKTTFMGRVMADEQKDMAPMMAAYLEGEGRQKLIALLTELNLLE